MKALSLLPTIPLNLLALITLLNLSACGGGSSGGSTPPPPSNAAPVFTSTTSVDVPENSSTTGYTATATDSNGDALSFSLTGGVDQSLFNIDSSTGVLSFISAPDFEAPTDTDTNNAYLVEITVADSKGGDASLDLSVIVTNINEAPPVFVSGESVTMPENIIVTGYSAVAEDIDGDTIAYRLSGGVDQALFSIDSESGLLSFNNPPNFEVPLDADINNVYLVEISADDDNGGITSLELIVTVTNLNELPVFTSPISINLPENKVTIEYVAKALDDDGDILEYAISGGVDEFLFKIDPTTGVLSLNGALDFERPIDDNEDNIYLIVISATDIQGGSTGFELAIIVTDVSQLSAKINFPTPNANLGGSATQITVTGRLFDSEDDVVLERDIKSFNINEQMVAVSEDEPANWSVQVPVVFNDIDIEASVESISGNIDKINLSLSNKLWLSSPRSIALDEENNQVLILDSASRSLLRVDLLTGNLTTVDNSDTLSGVNVSFVTSLAMDPENDRVLIVGSRLTAINLKDGNLITLSDWSNGIGTGPSLELPVSIALDAFNKQVFVLDSALEAVFAINLNNGNRKIISDNEIGLGEKFFVPRSLVLDEPNNRVLVIGEGSLVAVDLISGERTTLSSQEVGVGPSLESAKSIALDINNNKVFIISQNFNLKFNELLEIELATGNRKIISNISTGTGINFAYPESIELDVKNHRILVMDSSHDSLISVDLITGNRTLIYDGSTGSGPHFRAPHSIVIDKENNRALVVDLFPTILSAVDLTSGDRKALSSVITIGSGPNIYSPRSVVLDNNRVLVTDNGLNALLEIDLTSGHRTIISDGVVGMGPFIEFPESLAIDFLNNQALILNYNEASILAVDLLNGNRRVLSGESVGNGVHFISPQAIDFDSEKNRLLVIDRSLRALIEVDISNGNRKLISDSTIGIGPSIISPVSIVHDSEKNRVLYLDSTRQALIEIDLNNGNRIIISDSSNDNIQFFKHLTSLTLDSKNNIALILDISLQALIAVDLISGDKVITSK